MTFARTLSGQPVALEATVIDTVARRVAGRVLVESASEYQQARRVWNGLSDKRPAGIVRCSGVADVLDALRFARDHDLLVALRGGGHNVAGFGTCDGGHRPLAASRPALRGFCCTRGRTDFLPFLLRWRNRHGANRDRSHRRDSDSRDQKAAATGPSSSSATRAAG